MCDLTEEYIYESYTDESYTCATWLINMWHDYRIWKHITNMCNIIHWCATWLVNVWLDWRIHIRIIHKRVCDMTYQHVTRLTNMTRITNMYVIIHSCAPRLIHTRHDSFICDMTDWYVIWLMNMSESNTLTNHHNYPPHPPPQHAPWPTPYTHTLTFNPSRALSLSFWNTHPHTHIHFLNLFLSHSPSLLCSLLHTPILSHTHLSGSRYFKIGWYLWVMPRINESWRTFSWFVYM